MMHTIIVDHLDGDPVAAFLALGVSPDINTHSTYYEVTLPDTISEETFRNTLSNNREELWLGEYKKRKKQELASCRWEATQYFTFDGVRTQADPAMAAVTAAVVSSQFLPPDATRSWKLADGVFRTWTIQDIIAFGMAISTHIQMCFDKEQILSTAILDAVSQEELDAVDIFVGWPE